MMEISERRAFFAYSSPSTTDKEKSTIGTRNDFDCTFLFCLVVQAGIDLNLK